MDREKYIYKNRSTLLDIFPVQVKSMNHKIYVFGYKYPYDDENPTKNRLGTKKKKRCIQPQKHVYIEMIIYLPAAAYYWYRAIAFD